MPVQIGQNQYVTVAERVAALHEARGIDAVRILTRIVSEDDQSITVIAEVDVPWGNYTGHARSDKAKRSIEGQSPLEVAETSAIGRALGFAGLGLVEGIATADEVKAAQRPATRTVPQPATYKGNWSKFWALAKDKGMNKEDVHAYFGLGENESLADLAQERATEHSLPLQDELDALADVLRTVQQ